jgi:hypothetical protein
MRRRIMQNLSAARSQKPRPERAEPRLLPQNAPLPFRRPAAANAGILSATREDEPPAPIPTKLLGVDRRPATSARPVRALPFLAVAGLVALAVTVLAGVGFLMFTAPAKETVAASGSNAAEAPPAYHEPGPTSPETTTSRAAAAAVIPRPTLAQQTVPDNAAPKSQSNVAPSQPPAPPASAPPAPAAGPAERPVMATSGAAERPATATSGAAERPATATSGAAERPAMATPATNIATRSASTTAQDAASDRRAVSPATSEHRHTHTRIVARHAHFHSAREARASEQQARSARFPTPRASEQAASFERLVTQLTQPGKPVDQSLSPPAPGAPDPFAQPASDK